MEDSCTLGRARPGHARYTATVWFTCPGTNASAPMIAARMVRPGLRGSCKLDSTLDWSVLCRHTGTLDVLGHGGFVPDYILLINGPRLCREAAFGERIWLNQFIQTKGQQGPMLGLYLTAWTSLGVTILGGLMLIAACDRATGVMVALITQYVLWKQLSAYYCQEQDYPSALPLLGHTEKPTTTTSHSKAYQTDT